jgi:hypothetical protein
MGQQSCLGLEALPKINCRRPPVAAGAARCDPAKQKRRGRRACARGREWRESSRLRPSRPFRARTSCHAMWKCIYRKRRNDRKTITDMLPRLDGRGQRRYDGRNAVSERCHRQCAAVSVRKIVSERSTAGRGPGQVRSTQRPFLNATSSLSPSRKSGFHPKRLIWRLTFRSRPTLGESCARPFSGRSAVCP